MEPKPNDLITAIRKGWLSDDPSLRISAIAQIGEAADQGIELPKPEIIEILSMAMYDDFRSYEGDIWIAGLLAASKVCDAFGYDFDQFKPRDGDSVPPA